MVATNHFRISLPLLYITLVLLLTFIASCSKNDRTITQSKEIDAFDIPLKTTPNSICAMIEWLFSQECVRRTAKLDQPGQKQNIILLQERVVLDCAEINSAKTKLFFKATSITLDSFRNSQFLQDQRKRYFYLQNIVNDEKKGLIEIIYPYSGSIYKLTADKVGKEWTNVDFFCAKY